MVEHSEFKGFTLLELIVAMAIIAVLIGLSLLGIQTVQRSSRDTQRREYVSAINLELTDYYGNNSTYPATITKTSASVITIGTKTVTLAGAGVIDATLTTAPYAGVSGSRYCYSGGTTYSVGSYLESGTTFSLGNAVTACTASAPNL